MLGILDFVVAVTTVALTFPYVGVGPVLDGVPPGGMGTHPLAMIAVFAVPVSILLHLEVLRRLRSPRGGAHSGADAAR